MYFKTAINKENIYDNSWKIVNRYVTQMTRRCWPFSGLIIDDEKPHFEIIMASHRIIKAKWFIVDLYTGKRNESLYSLMSNWKWLNAVLWHKSQHSVHIWFYANSDVLVEFLYIAVSIATYIISCKMCFVLETLNFHLFKIWNIIYWIFVYEHICWMRYRLISCECPSLIVKFWNYSMRYGHIIFQNATHM